MSHTGCSHHGQSTDFLLRQDNADVRLTPLSHALGLASNGRLTRVKKKVTDIDAIIAYLKANRPERRF